MLTAALLMLTTVGRGRRRRAQGRAGWGTSCSAAVASERGGLGRETGQAARFSWNACGRAAHQAPDPEVEERIHENAVVVIGARGIGCLLL